MREILLKLENICDGFLKNYTRWTCDGKLLDISSVSETHESIDWTMDDRFEDMIRDV